MNYEQKRTISRLSKLSEANMKMICNLIFELHKKQTIVFTPSNKDFPAYKEISDKKYHEIYNGLPKFMKATLETVKNFDRFRQNQVKNIIRFCCIGCTFNVC